MGIKANAMNITIDGSTAEVTKVMQADPRMISEIIVDLEMKGADDEKTKTILERTAMTCPVFLSLHPDIKKTVRFKWN